MYIKYKILYNYILVIYKNLYINFEYLNSLFFMYIKYKILYNYIFTYKYNYKYIITIII